MAQRSLYLDKVTPVKDRLFVEFEPFVERKTKWGFEKIIREKEAAPNRGRVYAIGSGVNNCKVGDKVVYGSKKTRPRGFIVNDKTLMVVHKDDIEAVILE